MVFCKFARCNLGNYASHAEIPRKPRTKYLRGLHGLCRIKRKAEARVARHARVKTYLFALRRPLDVSGSCGERSVLKKKSTKKSQNIKAMNRTPVTTYKRKYRSPLQNTTKKVHTSEEFPKVTKMSDPGYNVETAKASMNEAKSKQLYSVQASDKFSQEEKKAGRPHIGPCCSSPDMHD